MGHLFINNNKAMISQETKDQIDDEADEFRSDFEFYSSRAEMRAYTKGAIKYAEKVEEKNEIIKSQDLELAQLKEGHDEWKKSAFEIKELKDKVIRYEAWNRNYQVKQLIEQLTQLKEIAEKMGKMLEEVVKLNNKGGNMNVTWGQIEEVYAEWCANKIENAGE